MSGKSNKNLTSIVRQLKLLEKKDIASAVKKGELLELAHDQCAHGQWFFWLRDNFGWSLTTAQRLRDVYALSQIPQFGGSEFTKLDLSLSALYLAAELGPDDPGTKALIKAAREARVTYSIAKDILAELKKPPPSDDDDDPPPDDDDDDDDDEDDDPPPDDDDDDPPPVHGDSEVAAASELLRRLGELLHNEPYGFWAQVIEVTGTTKVREIYCELKTTLDQYNKNSEIKAKADRAEAASANGGVRS